MEWVKPAQYVGISDISLENTFALWSDWPLLALKSSPSVPPFYTERIPFGHATSILRHSPQSVSAG